MADQLRTVVLDMLEEIGHFGNARHYEARLRRIGWIEGDKPPAVTKMMHIFLGVDEGIVSRECQIEGDLARDPVTGCVGTIGEQAFHTRDEAVARRSEEIDHLIEISRSEIERLEAMKS